MTGTPHATLPPMASRVRRSLLLASALFAVGCLSPTLPLPPPSQPEIAEVQTGTYLLTGAVPPNAEVYAYNLRTRFIDGQATDASGRYAFEIAAEPLDTVELWYTSGTRESQVTEIEIPAGP